MAQKELAIKMEKIYDLPESDTSKYSILAFFREQEAAKNKLESAMIATQSGIIATNKPAAQQSAPTQVSVNCPHPQKSYLIFGHEFTVTDLLLCFIAFFLFILLIIHD
ncbi:MAG: hypothetical protein J6R26_06360 [Paludibacteraceae bacterium]|nr:hypothetical protein [Paludibacteraceae bacterium]